MLKDVKGYKGLYKISSNGKVLSLGNKRNHKKQMYLKLHFDKDGYKKCILQKNKSKRVFRVCRLVAINFLENTKNFPVVNHKDENKTNDHYKNLEWTTYYGNWKHSNKGKEIKVLRISLETKKRKVFKSLMEAARKSFVAQGNISNCLSGRCKTVGGYKWRKL